MFDCTVAGIGGAKVRGGDGTNGGRLEEGRTRRWEINVNSSITYPAAMKPVEEHVGV